MVHAAVSWITDTIAGFQARYAVNGWIFLSLILLCGPPYYLSIYRLIRSAAAKNRPQISFWSTMFLLFSVIPYLYVLFWGRNLPWYIYGFIALLAGTLTIALVAAAGIMSSVAMANNGESKSTCSAQKAAAGGQAVAASEAAAGRLQSAVG